MPHGPHKRHELSVFAAVAVAALLSFAQAADCQTDDILLLLVTAEAEQHEADILASTLRAHLSGLGVRVTTERSEASPTELRAVAVSAAKTREAEIVVWASGDLVSAGVAIVSGESPSTRIGLPRDDRTFKARCSLIATRVLAAVEPLMVESRNPAPTPKAHKEIPSKPRATDPLTEKSPAEEPPPKKEASDPPPLPPPARPSTWRFAVSAGAALVVPTSKLSTGPGAGLSLSVIPPPGSGVWMISVGAAISRPKVEGEGISPFVGEFTFTNQVLFVSTFFEVSLRPLSLNTAISPFLALGPALQFARTIQSNSLGADNTESSWEPGLTASAGADIRLGPGHLLAQVRWIYADLDQDLTGDSNGGQIATLLGYRFVIPPRDSK